MKQSAKSRAKAQARRIALAKIEPPEDGKCQECHKLPDWRGLQRHHKIFRSQGGKDNPDNIVFVCGICHSKFHGIREV